MNDFQFAPDGRQARAFDERMRSSLAASLQHVREQIAGQLAVDDAGLRRVIADMNAGARYPLSTFGFYAEAVLAILNENTGEAQDRLGAIARERPLAAQGWRILPMDAPAHQPYLPLYRRMMDADENVQFRIDPPDAALSAAFSDRLVRSHALLTRALPELAAEFDALVSDIIMVVGDPKAKYQFDGGSAYMLWGGLFLNATSHPDEVAMIEVMAHESAHMLLYACAADEALVENDDDELFASPLRADPRPMDGIYHATFVSARMHWAMSHLAASSELDEARRAKARDALESDMKNFRSGYGVVAQHGLLTPTGRHVMDQALAYMDSAAT